MPGNVLSSDDPAEDHSSCPRSSSVSPGFIMYQGVTSSSGSQLATLSRPTLLPSHQQKPGFSFTETTEVPTPHSLCLADPRTRAFRGQPAFPRSDGRAFRAPKANPSSRHEMGGPLPCSGQCIISSAPPAAHTGYMCFLPKTDPRHLDSAPLLYYRVAYSENNRTVNVCCLNFLSIILFRTHPNHATSSQTPPTLRRDHQCLPPLCQLQRSHLEFHFPRLPPALHAAHFLSAALSSLGRWEASFSGARPRAWCSTLPTSALTLAGLVS